LPRALRNFERYFSLALRGSCFLSLLLARLLSNRILIFEAKLLTFCAFLITALSSVLELWQGLMLLLIGALLILIYRYAQMDKITELVVRLPWRLSPFYFALVIAVVLLISSRPVLTALRSGFSIAYTQIFISAVTPLLIDSQLAFSLSAQSLLYSLINADYSGKIF
jgi:hypothetical protein